MRAIAPIAGDVWLIAPLPSDDRLGPYRRAPSFAELCFLLDGSGQAARPDMADTTDWDPSAETLLRVASSLLGAASVR